MSPSALFCVCPQCPLVRKIKEDDIPEHYLCQVQTLLEVLDLELAHFVQYRPEGMWGAMEFSVLEVKRDRAWFARHQEAITSFIDLLQQHQLAPSPFVPEQEAHSPASLASEEDPPAEQQPHNVGYPSVPVAKKKKKTWSTKCPGLEQVCLIKDDPIRHGGDYERGTGTGKESGSS